MTILHRYLILLALALAAAGLVVFSACGDVTLAGGDDHTGGDDDTAPPDDDVSDDDADDDDADDDTVPEPPAYPTTHKPTWDCYICHENARYGAPGEPHGHIYTAPDDCVGCHQPGTQRGSPHGDEAHNLDQDCLSCHQGRHGKAWQERDQCLVCHWPEGDDDDDDDDDDNDDGGD